LINILGNIVKARRGMFEKSPALSFRGVLSEAKDSEESHEEIPRFARDDKKEGHDDKKEGSE